METTASFPAGNERSLVGAHLIFSSTNFESCTIECDALGISYRFSAKEDSELQEQPTDETGRTSWIRKLINITRWDPAQGREILVAQWDRDILARGKLRFVDTSTDSSSFVDGPDTFLPLSESFPVTFGLNRTSIL